MCTVKFIFFCKAKMKLKAGSLKVSDNNQTSDKAGNFSTFGRNECQQ